MVIYLLQCSAVMWNPILKRNDVALFKIQAYEHGATAYNVPVFGLDRDFLQSFNFQNKSVRYYYLNFWKCGNWGSRKMKWLKVTNLVNCRSQVKMQTFLGLKLFSPTPAKWRKNVTHFQKSLYLNSASSLQVNFATFFFFFFKSLKQLVRHTGHHGRDEEWFRKLQGHVEVCAQFMTEQKPRLRAWHSTPVKHDQKGITACVEWKVCSP